MQPTPPKADTDVQSDQVYRGLRQAIITGEAAAGARLKIMQIAADEGVSPGAVREALSRLVSDHLVLALHQRGFRVSELSRLDMLDLYATRAGLESQLVRASVLRGDPAWRRNLEQAYRELSDIGAQPTVSSHAAQIHETFHRALVLGCDSTWSMRLFETIYAASERYRYVAFRLLTDQRKVADEHDAIYRAAHEGHAEMARDLVFAHTMKTRSLLDQALAALPL